MNVKWRNFIISATLMLVSLMPQVISSSESTENGVTDYDPYRGWYVCSCPTLIAQCYCIWRG